MTVHAEPRSWAEDLKTYRPTRGSQSFAAVTEGGLHKSIGRTSLVPFCDTRHPLYPYNQFTDGGSSVQQDPAVRDLRWERHGWGDTTLLKEEGYAGAPHRNGHMSTRCGKAQVPPPASKDRTTGLFGVIQQTEKGGLDCWIGNPLIEPNKGKLPVQPPPDPKGRHGLFGVLSGQQPGVPADDAWIGNKLIDPAKGKASVPGPEQLRGRKDLTEVFNQSILRDPNRAALLKRGADPIGDAWCGNVLIHPHSGKAEVYGVAATEDKMMGAAFRPPVPENWSDLPRRHAKEVPPPVQDVARDVLNGTAKIEPMTGGRRQIHTSGGTQLLPRPDNLYAHMTYRPLSQVEQRVLSKTLDDGGVHRRAQLEVPGSNVHGKGPTMLAWCPEQAIGQFVPYGKLAQDGRHTKQGRKQNVQGGTMNKPLGVPRTLSHGSMQKF